MKEKILKFLRKIKYDYHYGLFDLFRRPQKGMTEGYIPERVRFVQKTDCILQDSLILISKTYPAITDHPDELYPLEKDQAIAHMAVENLKTLFEASEAATNETIIFTSTYRTLAFQDSIYGVNPYAAKPGESEHHSGLVADIKVEGFAQRRFIMSKTGKWMAHHAHEYGFIIRYPLWGERITGVDYEPWHLRYVGLPHSEIIYQSKIVLEDYITLLEKYSYLKYGNFILWAEKDENFSVPMEIKTVFCSKNTRGGYLLWGQIQ